MENALPSARLTGPAPTVPGGTVEGEAVGLVPGIVLAGTVLPPGTIPPPEMVDEGPNDAVEP